MTKQEAHGNLRRVNITKEIYSIGLLLIISTLISAPGCKILRMQETSMTDSPHFRQVWWGNPKASVLTKERGIRIEVNSGGSLVYKTRYKNVPMSLVYCFRSQQGIYRLRAAGYLTKTPAAIDNPDTIFRQDLFKTLGAPTETLTDGGAVWVGEDTVVYTNAFRAGSAVDVSNSPNIQGSIIPIPQRRQRSHFYHIITGYIDRDFYEEILNKETWEAIRDELTYHEKIFFGMFREVNRNEF